MMIAPTSRNASDSVGMIPSRSRHETTSRATFDLPISVALLLDVVLLRVLGVLWVRGARGVGGVVVTAEERVRPGARAAQSVVLDNDRACDEVLFLTVGLQTLIRL